MKGLGCSGCCECYQLAEEDKRTSRMLVFWNVGLSRGNLEQCFLPRNMAPLPSPLKSTPSCSLVTSAFLSFSRDVVHKLHRSYWSFLPAKNIQEGTVCVVSLIVQAACL